MMKRKLTRIGNSWGFALPKKVLELLDLKPGGEVEVQVIGNTLVVTPVGVDKAEPQAALTYLASKQERKQFYRKLADA